LLITVECFLLNLRDECKIFVLGYTYHTGNTVYVYFIIGAQLLKTDIII